MTKASNGVKSLVSQIAAATCGLWLADLFIGGVTVRLFQDSSFFGLGITRQWQIFLILGVALGLLNFFVKPVLNAITLPLRIITLGLFNIVISMAMIWALDAMFEEFSAPWLFPLLWTTLAIWGLNIAFGFFLKNED